MQLGLKSRKGAKMAHPYAGHRQTSVEHGRVKSMVKEYATGGAVSSNAKLPEPVRKQLAAKSNGVGGIDPGKPKMRSDKAPRGTRRAGAVTDAEKAGVAKTMRATGGRVKSGKGTNVNIVISPSAPPAAGQPVPVPVPVPPRPMPMPPPGAEGVPPGAMAGPAGLPPGMPMPGRKKGGRVVQAPGNVGTGRGGKLKMGSLNALDRDIPRTPGKFEGPGSSKGQVAVDIDAGAGSGEGRLEKTKIQKRDRRSGRL